MPHDFAGVWQELYPAKQQRIAGHGNEVVYRPETPVVWDVRPIVNE